MPLKNPEQPTKQKATPRPPKNSLGRYESSPLVVNILEKDILEHLETLLFLK